MLLQKDEYLMKKFSKYFIWICLATNFDVMKLLTQFLQGDALKQTIASIRNAFLAKAELQREAGANNNPIPFPVQCLKEIIIIFFFQREYYLSSQRSWEVLQVFYFIVMPESGFNKSFMII